MAEQSKPILLKPNSAEVDESLLDYNLTLSIEKRIENHELSRRLANELRKSGEAAHGKRES